MKKNQEQLYGLIMICIGVLLLILVGGPMLISLGALILGLYLINAGLVMRGGPSLRELLDRSIREIQKRF